MKAYKLKIILLAIIGGSLINGCYYDNEQDLFPGACDHAAVPFSDVTNLLSPKCFSCHSGQFPSANISLDSYAGVKTQVDNGKLMGSIKHETGFVAMPQGTAKLTDCDIDLIQTWINEGAKP